MDDGVVHDESMPSQPVGVHFQIRSNGNSQVNHHDQERLLESRQPPFNLQNWQQKPNRYGLTSLAKQQKIQRSREFVLGRSTGDLMSEEMFQLISRVVLVLAYDGFAEVHNKKNELLSLLCCIYKVDCFC